jgi:choline dehydrogenase-like flavoprotein
MHWVCHLLSLPLRGAHIRAMRSGLKTPHVLELSGIGGRTVLEAAGIPVKIELSAVGENIQVMILLIFIRTQQS